METYWVSLIIQNKDNKAWLCAMSDCETSLESAIETINKAKTKFVVLSAWVDTFDENNKKHTVFHECYVDCIGKEMKNAKIVITVTTEEPKESNWSYPLSEIPYLMEQIDYGDRENGYEFLLYNGRLYETEETEIM